MTEPGPVPTQCTHPARSAIRSTTATLIGLGPLVPVLVDQLGADRAALVIGVALAGNAIITRALAIPEVETFLRRALPWLAAAASTTDPGRHRRTP